MYLKSLVPVYEIIVDLLANECQVAAHSIPDDDKESINNSTEFQTKRVIVSMTMLSVAVNVSVYYLLQPS